LRVAVYLRVSTENQTVENQRADIESWLRYHQVTTAETEYYSENDTAWKAGHQRELARLLQDLRTGRRKYDVVLVWALDRLTRQGIVTILQLMHSFKICGARVCSVKEPFLENDSAMNEAFTALLAWAAKYDSDRKSERVRAAHDRLRALGKPLGRPPGAKDKGSRRKSGYLLRYASPEVRNNCALFSGGD
jgi:putative DNA-invertase from lambdoid prophage Rac